MGEMKVYTRIRPRRIRVARESDASSAEQIGMHTLLCKLEYLILNHSAKNRG